MIFKIIGTVGLILIILGTFRISQGKNPDRRNIYPFLLLGGVCLTVYSFYIRDAVFIILQIFYTLVVIYNITKLKTKRGHK
jgi:lipid-A-disaccharide synthase-like uncharacterized protein